LMECEYATVNDVSPDDRGPTDAAAAVAEPPSAGGGGGPSRADKKASEKPDKNVQYAQVNLEKKKRDRMERKQDPFEDVKLDE